MFTVILLTLVASVSCLVFYPGPCPDVKAMDNFNITAYATGKWYEIERYPNNWEYRGECVSKVFNVENGVYKFKFTDIVDHSQVYFEGYIEMAPNAGTRGIVNYISPAYEESEGDKVVPVYMLDTDYVNYVIGYDCKYDAKLNMRHDFAWVLSRSPTLEGSARKAVDDYLNKSTLIDKSKFIQTHFNADVCKS